jgi:hypothetical protein
MSLDATVPRSRRALLGAAIGAGVATVASALGRPAPVRALDPNDVVLGASNIETATTTISNTTATKGFAATAIRATSAGGYGVHGVGKVAGIFGQGADATADGVTGTSTAGIGVGGVSDTGVGSIGYAVQDGAGVVGRSWSVAPERDSLPAQPTKVGVYGEAYQAGGVGGYFKSASSGTALAVSGKAKFSRSKRVNIGAGKSSLKVYLTGVTSSSLVFAVLHSNRSGLYVRAVIPSSGYFTIYLNKATTYSTNYVAYFVVN